MRKLMLSVVLAVTVLCSVSLTSAEALPLRRWWYSGGYYPGYYNTAPAYSSYYYPGDYGYYAPSYQPAPSYYYAAPAWRSYYYGPRFYGYYGPHIHVGIGRWW